MKKVLTLLIILSAFFGIQAVLLGALYKIQSWEMPKIGALEVNLLGVGLVLSGLALSLLVLRANWSAIEPEKPLRLDELPPEDTAQKTPLKAEDELLL